MSLDTAKATAQLRGLTTKFDNAVRGATPFYPQVCTIAPSTGADERYAWLGNMPGVREWIGDRKFGQLRASDFILKNKKWETSLEIAKDDIADDRLGMYDMALPQLGIEAAYHPDELLFETAIVGGESTACSDGQYAIDTDHAWGDSGTQSNDLTYNAADHTAVTAAEFKAAYHAARKAMLKFKNDRGKLLIRPVVAGQRQFLVVVPPELEIPAYEGLKSQLLGGGNSNVVRDEPEIVVSAHLTSAVKWHLFFTGGALKPFVFQQRKPIVRGMKGLDDMETQDVKFMADARYNIGYLAWWTWVQTEFN